MAKVIQVFGFLGDGGRVFSGGFVDYLRSLDELSWCNVVMYEDSGRNYHAPVQYAMHLPSDQLIAGIGYSLGAWGAAWWAHYMHQSTPKRKIALIAGIDPAGRLAGWVGGLPDPRSFVIDDNVANCICVSNTVPWSPISWVFGGGKYVRAADGPQIDYRSSAADHLWMQYDRKVQTYITDALRKAVVAE